MVTAAVGSEAYYLAAAVKVLISGKPLEMKFGDKPPEFTVIIDMTGVTISGCCFEEDLTDDQVASLFVALWAWRTVKAAQRRVETRDNRDRREGSAREDQ